MATEAVEETDEQLAAKEAAKERRERQADLAATLGLYCGLPLIVAVASIAIGHPMPWWGLLFCSSMFGFGAADALSMLALAGAISKLTWAIHAASFAASYLLLQKLYVLLCQAHPMT